MGWARFRSNVVSLTIVPFILLLFLLSSSGDFNSSTNCTDYIGGCFAPVDDLAFPPPQNESEFQVVDEYLNLTQEEEPSQNETISGGSAAGEGSELETVPEEPSPGNETEDGQILPANDSNGSPANGSIEEEPSPGNETVEIPHDLPPEENQTGFMDIGEFINETGTEENETTEEFMDVGEFLNATDELLPEPGEPDGGQEPPRKPDAPPGHVVAEGKVLNALGQQIKADIVFKSESKGKPRYRKSSTESPIFIPEGRYDITITPRGHPIEEIEINNFEIETDLPSLVYLDTPPKEKVPAPPGVKFSQLYVFNPQAEISGTFTARARGTTVYKCKDWDFYSRICMGEWVPVLNVTPGELYTIDFDPADPAYGEGSDYFTLVSITLDGDFTDWEAVLANEHNTMSDGISGINDLDVVGTPNRDLLQYAFTWDEDYYYSYLRRTASGTNVVQILLYIDANNDNKLGTTDYVVRYSWQNNQGVDSFLYNYTPAIVGGDPITGDGQDENGTVSGEVSLESNLPGRGPNGIIMETRLNWSAIGLQPGSPIGLHVSTSRGTNLPSQLEDNMNAIYTLINDIDIEPDRSGCGANGKTVSYNHTITNLGNAYDTVNVNTSGTTPGFTVNIYYANGTPITDTNGDSVGDTGPLAPGESINITVNITIAGASSGDVDYTYVVATSGNNTGVSDSVLDTTYIGDIVIFPTESGRVINGSTIFYNHTVGSYLPGSEVINIIAISNNSYVVNLTYANGTPLTDTNNDSYLDIGNVTPGVPIYIQVWITVPAGAALGTIDLTTVTALKATDFSVNSSVTDTTTVSPPIEIFPNRTGFISVGAGDYIFYQHTVRNSLNVTDVGDLTYLSSQGWNVTFYAEDMFTLLTDTDGDGYIDTGNITRFGGTKTIYAKISHSGLVTVNTTDITNITVNSSIYTSESDQVTDNTTARILITYENAIHTIFEDTFDKTQTVYANSYGLGAYSKVYYLWYDSNGTLQRMSPDIDVDADDEAQDLLPLNYTLPSGQYLVYIYNAQNDDEITQEFFYVFGIPNVTVVTPNGGENWSGTNLVYYNVTDDSGQNITAWLQYSSNGGVTWNNIATQHLNTTNCTTDPAMQCVEGQFNYSWDTTTVPDGTSYLFRVIADNSYFNGTDDSDAVFTIDNTGPTVTLNAPPPDYVNVSTSPVNVTFNCSATDAIGLKNISLYITDSSNSSFSFNQSASLSGTSGSAQWELELQNGLYTWNCLAYDIAGNYDWGDANRSITIGNDVSNCAYLSVPNANYTLAANLFANKSDSICLTINASNITLDCSGFNITGLGGSTTGIAIINTSGVKIENCRVGNYSSAFLLQNANDSYLRNNTGFNSTYGMFVDPSYNNTIIENQFYNNSMYGLYLFDSHNNTIRNNTAYNNSQAGFLLGQSSSNNLLENNTAYGNPASGFHLENCSHNNLTGNIAHTSTNDGFRVSAPSQFNLLLGNTAYLNSQNGFYIDGAANNSLENNSAYLNADGFFLNGASFNNFTNNNASSQLYGFYITSSNNNTIFGGEVYNNSAFGIYIYMDENTTLSNCTVYENGEGIYLWNSSGAYLQNNRVYGNSMGFQARNTGAAPFTYNMTNTLFLPASGTLENYTNLSVYDSIEAATAYTINWTSNSSALPNTSISFAQKFVNISTVAGTPAIEEITWHWLDSELTGYNESKLEIWKYNESGWELLNYTADTANNRLSLYNLLPSSTYGILSDQAGPDIIWTNQTPADISSTNVFDTSLNITYNLTDPSGVNESSITIYYKTNSSTSDCWTYVNGSYGWCGWLNRTYLSSNPPEYLFRFWDNQIYPGTYNIDERYMETTPHLSYTLLNPNYLVKIQLLNVSNQKEYGMFEIMANATGTRDLIFYYCNSTYASGPVFSSPYCTAFYTLLDTVPLNHTHSSYSFHHTIPFSMDTSTGMIGGIYVTPTSYFVIRPTLVGSGSWNTYYISNVSRPDAIQTSTNVGNAWSNFAGTIDAHLHQYDGSDAFRYYVCALDNVNNYNCSEERYDYINLTGLPPTSPGVYNPTNETYCGNITINHTASISPNGYAISHYNISLLNSTGGFNKTIISNNSLNLSYEWDTTGTEPGEYIIKVEACDVLGQCSFGLSELFNFTGPCDANCPIITIPGSYQMDSNFIGAPNSLSNVPDVSRACIIIASPNVTFDCNLYNITNNGTADAVGIVINSSSMEYTNVTIRNCQNVSYYEKGMIIHNSSMASIDNSGAYNSEIGFLAMGSTLFNITYSIARNNSQNGFLSENSDLGALLYENVALENGAGFGISSDGIIVTGNNASGNGIGFFVSFLKEGTFTGNNASGNTQVGFYFGADVNDSHVSGNFAQGNGMTGITVHTSRNNTLENNLAEGNGIHGFSLSSSNHTTLYNNTARNNTFDGIQLLYNCTSNNLTENLVFDNLQNGIWLDVHSSFNLLESNTAYDNALSGIQLTDLSNNNTLINNTAYDNANGFALTIGFNLALPVSNNTLRNNTAYNNSNGFLLDSNASLNLIEDNTAYENDDGFSLSSAYNNTFIGIHSYNNTYSGVSISGGDGNSFTNITSENNTDDGFYALDSSNITIDPSKLKNNGAQGINLNNCEDILLEDVTVNDNKGHGLHMVHVERAQILTSEFCNNHQYGIRLHHTIDTNISNSLICNNSEYGLRSDNSNNTRSFSNNITNNNITGVYLDAGSNSNTFNDTFICFNGFDISNSSALSLGALDTCDSYENWTENNHPGCTFRCTDIWHYFYGNVSGSLILAPSQADTFYSWLWNGQEGKVYVISGNASIDWASLIALGRNTSQQNSSNDFTELDSLLGISAEPDNINYTFSYDGSNPRQTINVTVYEAFAPYVPVANVSLFTNSTLFGILWDSSQGGPQFNTSLNQDVVFGTGIENSGAYQYEIRIPETLATYKGGDVVEFWVELD